MQKFNLFLLLVVCISATVYPVTSVTRWFSSNYHDLRVTLRRYSHCIGDLAPLKTNKMSEFDFLIHHVQGFLNQSSFETEQLANISTLMDNICRPSVNNLSDSNSAGDKYDTNNYPVSIHINVTMYNDTFNTHAKEFRCRAIDEAMDAMFGVFKRAAYNKTEPLDFSVIHFYPNATNKDQYYNLTDLINTSWINSETPLESVCKITESVKDYVKLRISNSIAPRADNKGYQPSGTLKTLLDIIDRILDPILGLQRRLYWESNNMYEQAYSGLTNQLGHLRNAVGNGYNRVVKQFSSSANSTSKASNSTNAALNTTNLNRTAPRTQ